MFKALKTWDNKSSFIIYSAQYTNKHARAMPLPLSCHVMQCWLLTRGASESTQLYFSSSSYLYRTCIVHAHACMHHALKHEHSLRFVRLFALEMRRNCVRVKFKFKFHAKTNLICVLRVRCARTKSNRANANKCKSKTRLQFCNLQAFYSILMNSDTNTFHFFPEIPNIHIFSNKRAECSRPFLIIHF